MTALRDPLADLGAATEALLARYFADRIILSAGLTAELLDLDEKTLRAMTDDGIIRAVRRGRLRGYTERDIRAYLAEGPDVECRKEKQKATPAPGRGKVVSLSEIIAKKR